MKKFFTSIPFIIAAFLFASTVTYAGVTFFGLPSRGLDMEWKMDEGSGTELTDSSSGGVGGTLYNKPTWVDGRWKGGLSFNGTDQYGLSDKALSSLGMYNKPYTISAWVNVAPGETDGNIIHVATATSGSGWCTPFLELSSSRFVAESWGALGQTQAIDTNTITTGQWYHVDTTWDATNGLRLYVNGVLAASQPQSVYAASGQADYIFTAFSHPGCAGDNGFLNANMDDVRVYQRALSATTIHALYFANAEGVAMIQPHQSGLAGSFYAGDNFNTLVSTAVDQSINFDPADDSIGTARAGQSDHFTARWVGYVTPAYSEDYTFYTVSDDGARLYVNDMNNPIINAWVLQGPTEYSSTVHLLAGHRYPIKLEFWENDGGAAISLLWSSQSVPKDVIPGSVLSYGGGTTVVNSSRNTRIAGGIAGLWSFNGPDMHWLDATDGTAYDRSGNASNGTIIGMNQKTSPVPGVIGQALDFNGSSSCVTTSTQIFNHPSSFTIAGWVYPRSYARGGFFGQNDSIEFGFDGSGALDGWTPYGQGIGVAVNSTNFALNKWHYVALVGTGAEEDLYIDGQLSTTLPGVVGDYGTDNPDTFKIGCHVWDSGDPGYFNGKIDEVRAYNNVALSATQIKELYLMGK